MATRHAVRAASMLMVVLAVATSYAVETGEVELLQEGEQATLVEAAETSEAAADDAGGRASKTGGSKATKTAGGAKEEDCANSLSCKVGKQMKKHATAATSGMYNKKAPLNVKKIDKEAKKMGQSKKKMKETYQKLLAGKFKDEAKGKNATLAKKTLAKNVKKVLAKDEKKLLNQQAAQKKYESKKSAAKEKTKKAIAKAKEKSKKKMAEKNKKAKIKQKSDAKKPVSREGLIQKAAKAKYTSYKLRMAAAAVQHQFSQQNATKGDVQRADEKAKAAEEDAKAAANKAAAHAVKEETKKVSLKKGGKNTQKTGGKATAAGKSSEKAIRKAGNKSEGSGAEGKKAEGKKPEGKSDEGKPEGKSEGQVATKRLTSDKCTEAACKKNCQTDICLKYCLKCMEIKTEVVKYMPGAGLVTVMERAIHNTVDTVQNHVKFVDDTLDYAKGLDQMQKDADNYANAGIRSQYCVHCKKMCRQGHDSKLQSCLDTCAASAACKVGGTAGAAGDTPALDNYVEVHRDEGKKEETNKPVVDKQARAEKLQKQKAKENDTKQHKEIAVKKKEEKRKLAENQKKVELEIAKAEAAQNATLQATQSAGGNNSAALATMADNFKKRVKLIDAKVKSQAIMIKQLQQEVIAAHGKIGKLKAKQKDSAADTAPATGPVPTPPTGDPLEVMKAQGATIINLPTVTIHKTVDTLGREPKVNDESVASTVTKETKAKVAEKAAAMKGGNKADLSQDATLGTLRADLGS